MSICEVFEVAHYFSIGREARLELTVDFLTREVRGNVLLKHNGRTKRFQCESFDEAKSWYRDACAWVDKEGENIWLFDGEENNGEDDDE